MRVFEFIPGLQKHVQQVKGRGQRIGFVPTMGFLHEGHLSLVRESVARADHTIVSIFVNPAQFAPHEDFADYPRDRQRDLALLKKEGVDAVFIPDPEVLYPPGYATYVEVAGLQERLCGKTRPHFFRGVCTVVLQLFNIVRPDLAFFGQKDAQQAVIIQRMTQDLHLGIRIVVCPIVRDQDGLALSSRNAYLDPSQRQAALSLPRSLKIARRLIERGEKDASILVASVSSEIEKEPKAEIDYVEIVNSKTLRPRKSVKSGDLLALAVFIDGVRLIDNMLV